MKRLAFFSQDCGRTSRKRRQRGLHIEGLERRTLLSANGLRFADAAATSWNPDASRLAAAVAPAVVSRVDSASLAARPNDGSAQPGIRWAEPVHVMQARRDILEAIEAVNFNDELNPDAGFGVENPAEGLPGLPNAPGDGAGSWGAYDPSGNALPRPPLDEGSGLAFPTPLKDFKAFDDAFSQACDSDFLNGSRGQYGMPTFPNYIPGAYLNGDCPEDMCFEEEVIHGTGEPTSAEKEADQYITVEEMVCEAEGGLLLTDVYVGGQLEEDGTYHTIFIKVTATCIGGSAAGTTNEEHFSGDANMEPDNNAIIVSPPPPRYSGSSNSVDGNGPARSSGELKAMLINEIGADFMFIDTGRHIDPRIGLLGDGAGSVAGAADSQDSGGSVALASPTVGGGVNSPVVGESGGARPIDPADPNVPGGKWDGKPTVSGSYVARRQVIDPIDMYGAAAGSTKTAAAVR